jgi:hypothetical protein
MKLNNQLKLTKKALIKKKRRRKLELRNSIKSPLWNGMLSELDFSLVLLMEPSEFMKSKLTTLKTEYDKYLKPH